MESLGSNMVLIGTNFNFLLCFTGIEVPAELTDVMALSVVSLPSLNAEVLWFAADFFVLDDTEATAERENL